MSDCVVNENPLVGPLEIGSNFSLFLFGLFTLQTYNYWLNFPNDGWKLRYSVLAIFLAEMAHVMLTNASVYDLTVTHFGDAERVFFIPQPFAYALLVTGTVGPGVQAYYSYRIYQLSKKWPLTIICWAGCIFRFGALMVLTYASAKFSFIPNFEAHWRWLVLASLSVSAAIDIIVATALSVLLWKHRTSGIKSTKRRIDTLIMFTINTGLVTCTGSLMMLIFFVAMPNTAAWLCMLTLIPHWFGNSLVASLNSRIVLRQRGVETYVHELSDMGVHSIGVTQSAPISVKVRQTHEVDMDHPTLVHSTLDMKGSVSDV